MNVSETVALWAHALSTVIVLGYYGILGRIVLPGLERSLDEPEVAGAVQGIERRAVPFVAISVVAFILSGVYLLAVDPSFEGIGRYDSGWAALMLVKHLLVGLMVLGGVAVHWLVGQAAESGLPDGERRASLGHVRLASEATTALGALILLLTAAAQAS